MKPRISICHVEGFLVWKCEGAQVISHGQTPMDAWQPVDPNHETELPIEDADGGCDDEPPCPQRKAWTRQQPAIEIAKQDAITDSGQEVYNLLQQHGISNVIVMGVHTNMCVLGRSFGIPLVVLERVTHRLTPFLEAFLQLPQVFADVLGRTKVG